MIGLPGVFRGFTPEVVVPGKRLGRQVHHDSRSLAFALAPPSTQPLASTMWERLCEVWNQGDVGSCTGEAGEGALATNAYARLCTNAGPFTQEAALALYAAASQLDSPPGYPTVDEGSSGLAVAKALKARGVIPGYSHTFTPEDALRGAMLHPGNVGFTWLEGCDEPDAHGVVRYEGRVRGGHETVLMGIEVVLLPDGSVDLDRSYAVLCNSWGREWGDQGYYRMSFRDFGRALADNGDVVFYDLE